MDIARRRVEMRSSFLRRVYEMVEGRTNSPVQSEEVGRSEQELLTKGDLNDVLGYLEHEHLIAGSLGLSTIWLTHDGKKEVEEAARERAMNPAASGIQFGDVSGSLVQIAGSGSDLNMETTINVRQVALWLEDARRAVVDLDLPPDEAEEFKAEMATIRSQLDSPHPKSGIIREALHSLRSLLEGAAGGVAAQALLHGLRILGVR